MEIFVQRVEIIIQCVKTIIALILRSLPFFISHCCALLVTSCCCLNHSSADDETSNILKRSVKNMFAHVLALCLILR